VWGKWGEMEGGQNDEIMYMAQKDQKSFYSMQYTVHTPLQIVVLTNFKNWPSFISLLLAASLNFQNCLR
jgi:hypothetical protein